MISDICKRKKYAGSGSQRHLSDSTCKKANHRINQHVLLKGIVRL